MPGQPIFDQLPLERLHFDPQNPRFPESLDRSDESAVLTFMLQDAGLLDLMRSISAQGFFPGEPLLVSPQPRKKGHWVVVEGNRRLAACQLLNSPEKAPTSERAVAQVAAARRSAPTTIPCLRFASRREILQHLGYRHVTGIKEWEPLAKARFLNQRYQQAKGPVSDRLRAVARTIGSRSDYVGRLLTALAVYGSISERQFFDIDGLSETSLDFSLISSVLAYSNIVEFLGLANSQDLTASSLDVERVEELTRWVYERDRKTRRTRLGESRNIRYLAELVADPDALAAFRKGASLERAAQIASGASAFRSYVAAARESVELAREQLPAVRVDQADVELVAGLATAAVSLRAAAQKKVDGE